MITKYQLFNVGGNDLGQPGDFPASLGSAERFDAESLADLSWTDPELGFQNKGLRAVEVEDPPEVVAADLERRKATAYQALNLNYDARFEGGFPWAFGEVAETLQMRDRDQVNWLVFKDTCNDGINAGLGEVNCPQPIRVTSNVEYTVTYQQGWLIMSAMKVWGGAQMRQLWAKRDAIRLAADVAALEAIDLNDWPNV